MQNRSAVFNTAGVRAFEQYEPVLPPLRRRSTSRSRWLWIIASFLVVLPLVISLVIVVGYAYGPLLQDLFTPGNSSPVQATAVSTPEDASTPTSSPLAKAAASPTPSPPARPLLTLVWSKEYSQVYLRREPGGNVILLLDNGSSLLVSEVQTVQGVEWAHGLYFDGEEDVEGWVAASQVFTVRSDLPLALVNGENGANLRAEAGGARLGWLPQNTPVQIIETADVDGVAWAHVLLPDERRGWVAQQLLNTTGP